MSDKNTLVGKVFKALGALKTKLEKMAGPKELDDAEFGILQVALMMAALDGKVLPEEYAAFDSLARKCRGYTPESAAAALDVAIRSCGYLVLQRERLSEAKFIESFSQEACKALPGGFLYGGISRIRSAFVMWTAMAMSDGDYSTVERKGLACLMKLFGTLKAEEIAAEAERWSALSPAFRMAYGEGVAVHAPPADVKLLPADFLARAEAAVAALQGAKTPEAEKEALAAIGKLVAEG